MDRRKLGNFFVRISLAIVFLVAGLGKVVYKAAVPSIDMVITFLPAETSSLVLGGVELLIALLLILGLWTRVAGWAAAILLAGFLIAGSVLGMFVAAGLLKDIALLGAALYLGLVGARSFAIDSRMPKE